MKLLHLGDLHFGKKINNLSLKEDQEETNRQILTVIQQKKIDAVLIAGDVYDKSVPSEEAVAMLDEFLVSIAKLKVPVLIIAGNHDSVERLSFGDKLIEAADIYISPEYKGTAKKVQLSDEYGVVNFYLMPFVKPINVRKALGDDSIETYTDALHAAIKSMNINPAERNVILSHQFVTGADKGGSEDEFYVGGISNVDSWVYDEFDYTALGHIHKPQVIKENIRYCGSPIKFSFNEEKQEKKLTIVELKAKGTIDYDYIPLKQKHEFVTIKGTYDDIKNGTNGVNAGDFVRVVLTDNDDVPNAFCNLTEVYPNILMLSYENNRTRNTEVADGADIDMSHSPEELIKEFYKIRNNEEMNEEQSNYITGLIQEIWGDN